MKEIFFFDSMLTPKIITIVYWLLLLSILISGLGAMFGGYGGAGGGGILTGLGIIILGAVSARIWCELLIVLFKIHGNIKKLAEEKA